MNGLTNLKRDVYTVVSEGDGYRVTKFNSDLTVVSFYAMSLGEAGEVKCTCPQSNRGPCRHLDILEAFTELYPERVNSGWFYCYDTMDWFPPIEPDQESPMPSWIQPQGYNPAQLRVDENGNLVPFPPITAANEIGGGVASDVASQRSSPVAAPEVEAQIPPMPPSGAFIPANAQAEDSEGTESLQSPRGSATPTAGIFNRRGL